MKTIQSFTVGASRPALTHYFAIFLSTNNEKVVILKGMHGHAQYVE